MRRGPIWIDKAIVWLYAALIDAAIVLIRFIRRRERPGAEETR